MAKITVTIEDNPMDSQKFKVEFSPKVETLAKMAQSGHEHTPAERAAFFLATTVWREYGDLKNRQNPTQLILPKVKNIFK